ncbi:MAG: helix-turn-helix domain-containing protein, partial [Lachnospiraceae bacterium]|nr:helix-turn-helix domain-containing protein [Lachnospiraceae bacterium]
GEVAYPLIQKTRPDILITDIKMPFMDGLELSRLVKEEMPMIKILILSGYEEFEYAREAINIGIAGYLLKPVSGSQLLAAVKKVGAIVEEERLQRELLHKFERDREENTQLARQRLFRSLVSGEKTVSALLNEGKEIGMALAANRYNIVLFRIFFGGETAGGYSEKQNVLAQQIEEMTEKMEEVLTVDLGMEGWAFILKETGAMTLEETEAVFLDWLQAMVREAGDELQYFGGVGRPVCRLSEMSQCYESACRAFAYRYLAERNQIVRDDEHPVYSVNDGEVSLSSLNVKNIDRRVVESFLKTGVKSEITLFLDKYFESLGEWNVQSLLFRQYVTMDIYFAVVSMLEQLGYASDLVTERFGDLQEIMSVILTTTRTREFLINLIDMAIELRETVSRKKYVSLLKEARTYIEQNYYNENISLNTVAASVNLSPNHFSTIFSQEMGQTFIEFLTYVRMEKAKELLRSTSMKTAEIGSAVGYKDSHYFSYLFKKTQECTPREFRSRV